MLLTVACFYLGLRDNKECFPDFYRAIYLTERTLRELVKKITEKQDIDLSRVDRIFYANQAGLRIIVDDDVVSHIPDGQNMIVDICEGPNHGDSGGGGLMSTQVDINLTY